MKLDEYGYGGMLARRRIRERDMVEPVGIRDVRLELSERLRKELAENVQPDMPRNQRDLYNRIILTFDITSDELSEHFMKFGCSEHMARMWLQNGCCPSSRYQELCRYLGDNLLLKASPGG